MPFQRMVSEPPCFSHLHTFFYHGLKQAVVCRDCNPAECTQPKHYFSLKPAVVSVFFFGGGFFGNTGECVQGVRVCPYRLIC